MKHPANKELFAYWDACRGTRAAPDRDDIDPAALRRLLADTFILTVDAEKGHPFRLAGTRLCALFGRELKGTSFTALWHESDQATLVDLLDGVIGEPGGLVAGIIAETDDGFAADAEMVLLPLARLHEPAHRLLGRLATHPQPFWLGAKTATLSLQGFRYLEPAHRIPRDPLVLRRHGFTIYEGGRR
ncbi:MAG: PAS domain-containing protein [Pseudorhodoplanes sp.]